jgi:glutamine amidotransferase
MSKASAPTVAIVDYGMGNLFSVKHACEHTGLAAEITSSRQAVLDADAVILPGVGAFGDAMATLREFDLVSALQEVATAGKPLVGICLGMQLLMEESFEFGRHAGLGIIPGTVIRFENPGGAQRVLKVPQVCWNRLYRVAGPDPWAGTLLQGLPDGVFMYFVHSFYVQPEHPEVAVATTRYGSIEFCSALSFGNIFACQCHPERSGPQGLQVYRHLAALLAGTSKLLKEHVHDLQKDFRPAVTNSAPRNKIL